MQLTQREARLVIKAIDSYLSTLENAIELLDEPDERYERYDLQQDEAFLQSARRKLKEAAK